MRIQEVGTRPGEKLQELISKDEARYTYEYEDFYKILSLYNWNTGSERIEMGKEFQKTFFTSDNNVSWLRGSELKSWIDGINYNS